MRQREKAHRTAQEMRALVEEAVNKYWVLIRVTPLDELTPEERLQLSNLAALLEHSHRGLERIEEVLNA